ncbi:MAG TPA: nuclear transport factor 2 family protein [Methylomirabilota bacterium]|nr:nuclear transport factor 2 family protein [Methylomirabilota bacterium]
MAAGRGPPLRARRRGLDRPRRDRTEVLHARPGSEWEGFSLAPGRWHDAGETVVLECRYAGTYRLTGKRLDAQACHVWTVRDGKIQRFQQYINTVHLRDVMGAA